jgi:hypothetical protein
LQAVRIMAITKTKIVLQRIAEANYRQRADIQEEFVKREA